MQVRHNVSEIQDWQGDTQATHLYTVLLINKAEAE